MDEKETINCRTVVGFIEGTVTVSNIPEEIISDIHVSIIRGRESFPQASRYVKIDEPYHFIVDPGEYTLECSLDQVKLKSSPFTIQSSERKVVNFHFVNEG